MASRVPYQRKTGSNLTQLILAVGVAVLAGCGPDPGTKAPAPVVPTRPLVAPEAPPPAAELSAFPASPGEPRYRRVLSKRHQVSLPLPDRKGWTLERDGSSFLVMKHGATSSSLVVRVWREQENMNRDRCEERVRRLRDLPDRGREINRRLADIPSGFDSQVDVGFAASPPGEPLAGYVLAFGAKARRCFAFAYETAAGGPRAEQIVADRLLVIDGLTLEGLELRSDIPGVDR